MSFPSDPRLRPSIRLQPPSEPVRRRPLGGCLLVVVALVALLGGAMWLYPPLLLDSVDAVRNVVGPAPVAYVETYVFKLNTLVRETRVEMGDTAPRWQLSVSPVASRPTPPATRQPAVQLSPSSLPSVQAMTPVAPVAPTATIVLATATLEVAPETAAIPTVAPSLAPAFATPTPEITPELGLAEIIRRGGNMRTEPRVAAETVIGLLWPNDQIIVLEQQDVGEGLWYRVRVAQPAVPRGGDGVLAGQEGWMSALLLTEAPTPTPTPNMLLQPSPVPLVTPTVPQPIASSAQPAPTSASAVSPSAQPASTSAPQTKPTVKPQPTAVPVVVRPPPASAGPRADWPPPALPVLINDGQLPGEGEWQLLGSIGDGGDPRMAVTVLRPDPTRPDIQVAMVAMDMTRATLHLVAGTEEPPVISGTTSLRTGVIPPDAQQNGTLLAAFNGGFKAVHGTDGMAADGEIYAPPVKGRATIAMLDDGSLRLGLWGREIGPDDALVAWRQNGYLLVDGGAVTARAQQGGLGWGATVDLQAETWRSGVGLSADGRTLFYAVGDGLTAPRLAEVLRAAGSQTALQLDINNWWVRFVTFGQAANGRLLAQSLISAMPNETRKYLVADKRDFFYLSAR